MTDNALLRIGAVSRATGVAVSTLRSWEARYGLPTPARTSGGHRLYTETAIDQVRDVQSLVTGGASTSAAAALVLSRQVQPLPPATAVSTGAPEGSAVPLAELLVRTRAAKAESHRLRAELVTATATASATLGALQNVARALQRG